MALSVYNRVPFTKPGCHEVAGFFATLLVLRWKDILYYAKYSNPEPPRRIEKTEAEWQAQLTPAQFRVLRQQGTEPPYRNAYCRSYEPGVYACAGCGSRLFDSTTKYHAMSGWPSFTQPIARNAIRYLFDDSHHMQRVEARCNVCGGHLGHVFSDGPEPGGLRYCMNSESLMRLDQLSALFTPSASEITFPDEPS